MADATEALPFCQHVLLGKAGCTRRRRGATLCRGSSLPKESIHTCAQHGGTKEVSEPSQYWGLQRISQGSLWSWQHRARTPGAKLRVPGICPRQGQPAAGAALLTSALCWVWPSQASQTQSEHLLVGELGRGQKNYLLRRITSAVRPLSLSPENHPGLAEPHLALFLDPLTHSPTTHAPAFSSVLSACCSFAVGACGHVLRRPLGPPTRCSLLPADLTPHPRPVSELRTWRPRQGQPLGPHRQTAQGSNK